MKVAIVNVVTPTGNVQHLTDVDRFYDAVARTNGGSDVTVVDLEGTLVTFEVVESLADLKTAINS